MSGPLFSWKWRSWPPGVWELLGWISGVFTLLIALVMVVTHLDTPTLDPLKSPGLKTLKSTLRENPADEQTKTKIRELDLRLRRKYFQLLSRTTSGARLLAGGASFFILALIARATARKPLPILCRREDFAQARTQSARLSRWSVAGVGTVVGLLLFLLTLVIGSSFSGNRSDLERLLAPEASAASAPGADVASSAEMLRNWPRFRGPGGNALATVSNAPLSWDAKTGAGIAWKTPVLGKGFNSPIVWNERIFYSGGDAALREVFCHELATGQLRWRRAITNVPGSPATAPEIPESTGYCAGSMATDGRRVYTMFANGDLAALSLEGQPVWSKGFGALKNPYGHATSLTTWQDRLIVQLDQGEAEERKSRLYAIDGRSGKVIWQKERPVGSSWATPIVIEASGKGQIITLGIPAIIAYAAADGAELWRVVDMLSGEITPSPVFAGGQVVVASPSDKLISIRPDGLGDVTKTHIAWTNEDNVPDVTSPVSNGDLVFTVTTSGMLTCLDAKDGKKQWEHDFEFECHASPSIAAGRVYFLGEKGTAVIVDAARQFKELFRSDIPDSFNASPAFVQDKMVLRGATNLWCIGPRSK